MKRRIKTVGLRLTPKEWRWIQAQRREDETLSDTVRRLLLVAFTNSPA